MSQQTAIPGYTYGTAAVAASPVTVADFELMKKSALFGDEDVKYLRLSHDVVKDQVEAILDVWYGFVGSQPHLLKSFLGKSDGKPLGDYLGECVSDSLNGFSIRLVRSTTRNGSTISTRSACVIIVRRKTARTTPLHRRKMFHFATSLPSSSL